MSRSSLQYPLSLPAVLVLAGPAVLLPLAVCAEEATEIDPVVVTATRTARTVDASLASVTVIDRADIERVQARSVPDLLTGAQCTSGWSAAAGQGRSRSCTCAGPRRTMCWS